MAHGRYGNARISALAQYIGGQVWSLRLNAIAIKAFTERYPDSPAEHLVCADFFTLSVNDLPVSGQFYWVMEQTLFCAINPSRRDDYIQQMAVLLKPQGKLVGLLFDADFGEDFPPFGGTPEEYHQRIAAYFDIEITDPCYNSRPARKGNELVVKMRVKP